MEIKGYTATREYFDKGALIEDSYYLEELDVEIERSSGRIFVKEGTNLMNYIKDGKVWVAR